MKSYVAFCCTKNKLNKSIESIILNFQFTDEIQNLSSYKYLNVNSIELSCFLQKISLKQVFL